jgi:hypothetical protein
MPMPMPMPAVAAATLRDTCVADARILGALSFFQPAARYPTTMMEKTCQRD